jgi:hypothetical protein
MLRMLLTATCPKCRMKFRFHLRDRGREVKCLFCKRPATLPIGKRSDKDKRDDHR